MPQEKLITHPEVHPHGWGRELWIANGPTYCGKILEFNKGKHGSIHYHKIKDETFHLLSGKVQIDLYLDGYPGKMTSVVMKPGDTLHLPPERIHHIIGIEDSRILEISTQHFEEDTYRHARGD